jgi:methyl-accepting chemotaxis protein
MAMALTVNRGPMYPGNGFLNMAQLDEEITQVIVTIRKSEEITQMACWALNKAITTIRFWISKVMEAQKAITDSWTAKGMAEGLIRVYRYAGFSRWNSIDSSLIQSSNEVNSVGETIAMAQMTDETAAHIKDTILCEYTAEDRWAVYQAVQDSEDKSRRMLQLTSDVKSELPKMVQQVAEAKIKIQDWAETVAAGRSESWEINQGWTTIEKLCQDAMKINDIPGIDGLISVAAPISQAMAEVIGLSHSVGMIAYPNCCFGTQMA